MISRTPAAVAVAAVFALALTAHSALSLTAAAGASANATPAQILAALNAERVANGLPGGITENPQWSSSCALHDHYMAVNNTLTHFETAGAPAYTDSGAFAGQNAILSEGTSWLRADPWLNAPIHLDQLMSPLLQSAGAAEAENFNCLTTFIGYDQGLTAPTDELFSFPGNGGSAPYAQTAFEAPHTPGEWVGLPAGTQTGPYLIVYWLGVVGDPNPTDNAPPPGVDPSTYVDPTPPQDPLSVLTAATVTGPDGPVAIDVLNSATHTGDGYYLAPNSGFVLPVHPLRPNTLYQVTATFSTDPSNPSPGTQPRSWTGSFSFHTTNQTLTLNGPAATTGSTPTTGSTTPTGSQTPTATLPAAASGLRAPSTVFLRHLRAGQLAISAQLTAAPARLQALLTIGHHLLGASRVVSASNPGRVMLTLTLDTAGIRRLARRGSLRAVLRVEVILRGTQARAVQLSQPLRLRV